MAPAASMPPACSEKSGTTPDPDPGFQTGSRRSLVNGAGRCVTAAPVVIHGTTDSWSVSRQGWNLVAVNLSSCEGIGDNPSQKYLQEYGSRRNLAGSPSIGLCSKDVTPLPRTLFRLRLVLSS